MRLLKHPGRPQQPRRLAAVGQCAGEWRVTLPPGCELTAELPGVLAARGVRQAAVQLVCGGFEELHYQTGEPDPLGARVVAYGAPHRLEGPATLVGGNGILGLGADGRPLLHCQAVVVDAGGRLCGGRLSPGGGRVGAEGLVVQVVALAGAGFAAAPDGETGSTLFQPREGDA